MNFLAHLLLSYPNADEMAGNFMGDFIKGRKYMDYPEPIKQGILLHRAIDDFTDNNAIAKELVALLRPVYNRYAGVVSDIIFDHILAKNFEDYCNLSLDDFAENAYELLIERRAILPHRLAYILDRIRESRRLQTYATHSGIENSLDIMAQHTSLPNYSKELMLLLIKEESQIIRLFESFFPELQLFVVSKRTELR